jgi:regulator of CtrA degradation
MAGKKKRPKATPTVVILPGLYDETLDLLAQAHDYFYRQGEKDQAHMSARQRTMYASEMSRITLRLSSIMAWLMVRKAVFIGKLTAEEAQEKHRLDCRDASMNQNIEAESQLPDTMTDLLDKSFELYQRVARLDALSAEKKVD